MPDTNFLNLTDAELDMPVYRIMPVHRLLECLQKKQLALVPPAKWDDPFENFLLASKFKIGNEMGDLAPIKDKIYGQCWTMHSETDAMWRIYSQEKNGVKVKSSPRRLLDALKTSDIKFNDIHCFIGRVQYKGEKDLVTALQAIDLFNSNGSGLAESLLHKRSEFSHEKEVRLIYTDGHGPVHPFAIDPNVAFDEVIFDPRMDEELYAAFKAAVLVKGFVNRVDKSILYRPPAALMIRLPPG